MTVITIKTATANAYRHVKTHLDRIFGGLIAVPIACN